MVYGTQITIVFMGFINQLINGLVTENVGYITPITMVYGTQITIVFMGFINQLINGLVTENVGLIFPMIYSHFS